MNHSHTQVNCTFTFWLSFFQNFAMSVLKNHKIDVLASCAGAIRTPGYNNAQNAKDAPGTLNADQVVAETLNALGKGATVVPGFTNKLAHFFMGRLFPRKLAISIMHKNTKNLT